MSFTVCALGLDLTQENCPRAPCSSCMRLLGDELAKQISVLNTHRAIARERGEVGTFREIDYIMGGLNETLDKGEVDFSHLAPVPSLEPPMVLDDRTTQFLIEGNDP